jgi:hypothetical protein
MDVGRSVLALLLFLVGLVSCTPDGEDTLVSSPPSKHPELIVESGPRPADVGNFGLLVSDPDGLEWAWKWFGLSGPAPLTSLKHESVLLLAFVESGSCPLEYEGFRVVGATVEIASSTNEGPCTADAHYRSMVLRLPSELPDEPLSAEVEGEELLIHRLSPNGRWLRDAILRWFEDVPERRLPEQGVLGGSMRARVIAFPSRFAGTTGDEFFVVLDDGHVVSTFRYVVTNSLFWEPGDRVRHGELPWKTLRDRHGYEIWEVGEGGFAPYMGN